MTGKKKRIEYDIKDCGVSRAIYAGADEFPRLRIEFTTITNDKVEFEMSAQNAHKLIQQLLDTYYAIIPPLSTRRTL